MPTSSRHTRTVSPPLTTASYSNATTIGQQKLNVVTRLAIEGKSKKDWDGASIKMYLKITLPLDAVTPGASIPLFPEENLKILDAQVHPLDSNSAPYNFSPVEAPLLQKAARALNLAARLPTPYLSFTDAPSSSASVSTHPPVLDARYTGSILVSGYHISYVAPREFPRREHETRSRRGASVAHFMAAIDLWVPFLSKPPHAPYLLSIPVPRCLSNQIRLRIFPPSLTTASSLASLSSADEDGGGWDLSSDPHVTPRQSSRLSRSHSYNNFADDESSDTSTTTCVSEGHTIQGSFPSTDRIRVRWASPAKTKHIPETADHRQRVGIREVKGDTLCSVLARHRGRSRDGSPDGLVVKLDYTATCRGVWFPGVATLLGMDLGLNADDCDVTWAPGYEPKWTVTGSAGFTGFAVGGPSQSAKRQPVSRQSSAEYPPSIYVLPSSPNGRLPNGSSQIPIRNNSNGSTASTSSSSLLRAPLPAHNVADYSFESSPVSTPSGTVSSLPSLSAPSSPERARRRRSSSRHRDHRGTDTEIDEALDDVRPPRAPITVHLNMNELSPPPKNVFSFSVSGTVLICPRRSMIAPDSRRSSPASSEDDHDDKPVSLPAFHIFSTGQETTSIIVRNEARQASVHVFTRNEKHGTNVRKAVLMKGNQVSCGNSGVCVVLSPISSSQMRGRRPGDDSSDLSLDHTGVSLGQRSMTSTSRPREISMMSTTKLQTLRDGPLMIPHVNVKITSLPVGGQSLEYDYAVEVTLPAPSDADSEWLEFGLALPSHATATKADGVLVSGQRSKDAPQVRIASASVEGVPVRCQTSATVRPQVGLVGLGRSVEEISSKEWVCWVSIHVGHIGIGNVTIIYLVKGKRESLGSDGSEKKAQKRQCSEFPLDILLPSFALPVGKLQVDIPVGEGYKLSSVHTNLMERQTFPHGLCLIHYDLAEFHQPQLSAEVITVSSTIPTTKRSSRSHLSWFVAWVASVLAVIAIIFFLGGDLPRATTDLYGPKQAALHDAVLSASDVPIVTETVTVTSTTTFSPGIPGGRWDKPSSSRHPILTSLSLDTLSPTSSITPNDQESQDPMTRHLPPPSITQATDQNAIQSTTVLHANNHPFSIMSAHYFTTAWSWQKLLPARYVDAPVTQSAKEAAHAVIEGMGVVWQIVRKIIHYPLDPP